MPPRSQLLAISALKSRLIVTLTWSLVLFHLFLLFIVASVYFGHFNSDWPYYMSEALCSDASRSTICGETGRWPSDLFLEDVRTIIDIPDLGARFTSESFTRFYDIFLNPSDTLASATAKIHIFKSLVATSLTSAALYLTKRFPGSHHFASRAALCLFAFPYVLFTASSVYPSPLAAIAVLPMLICLKVISETEALSVHEHTLVAFLFIMSLGVIMANRFETTIFSALAIALVALKNWARRPLRKRLVCYVASFVILLGVFSFQNSVMQSLLLEAIQLKLRVLSFEAAETSRAVRQFGDAGYSMLAPVTFVDNSTRNLMFAIGNTKPPLGLWSFWIIIISWTPLIVVLFRHLIGLFQPLEPGRRRDLGMLVRSGPSLLCLALFIFIPSVFRAIWFFQYAAPLIMITLFFADHDRLSRKSTKLLFAVGIVSNLLTLVSVARTRNAVVFWSVSLESHSLIIVGLLAGSVALGASSYAMEK